MSKLPGRRLGWRRALTLKVAVLVGLAAALGCSSNVCVGVATCYGDQASQCQDVPGCAPTPGCMVNLVNGQDCQRPRHRMPVW
jgi:hypothetical protein